MAHLDFFREASLISQLLVKSSLLSLPFAFVVDEYWVSDVWIWCEYRAQFLNVEWSLFGGFVWKDAVFFIENVHA